ncbi:MAG TPA: NAD(P)-dependent oxidoreductase [Polyangia bacterium]|nr:NAD(P)-dependent oxidoreductase [Polyangia bacterium]
MARVAFLGLGKMGSGMAARLLAHGHDVRVFNRTAGKADPLVRAGATLCASPREAASGATAIFAMTADDRSSRTLWCGPDGALAGEPTRGTFAIECSTLSHDWVLDLAARASKAGLRYLDAPVTGLPAAAAAGQLTLLVGAAYTDLRDAGALLAPLADRILHFGAVGAGTAYKLMINLMGAVQIAAAAEGMALAERAGLSLPAVAEAIALGQAASPQVVRNTRRMADDDHERDVVFTPALRLKDVEYGLALARKFDVGSPFAEVAASLLRRLCAEGHAEANESKIIDVARALRPT